MGRGWEGRGVEEMYKGLDGEDGMGEVELTGARRGVEFVGGGGVKGHGFAVGGWNIGVGG